MQGKCRSGSEEQNRGKKVQRVEEPAFLMQEGVLVSLHEFMLESNGTKKHDQ